MAHYVPTDGIENFTGALSKKKIQGVNHMTVTRRKKVKDPLTGEVVGLGPKEIYAQERRVQLFATRPILVSWNFTIFGAPNSRPMLPASSSRTS